MKRDLPNSMAIVGSPEEHVAALRARLNALVPQLRRCDRRELWELLRVMATQTDDETLVATASEIAWRLSHDRFNDLEAHVRVETPSNVRAFKERGEQLAREADVATPEAELP